MAGRALFDQRHSLCVIHSEKVYLSHAFKMGFILCFVLYGFVLYVECSKGEAGYEVKVYGQF